MSSQYNIELGATNVKKDFSSGPDQDDTGFSGSIKFSADLSSRSIFRAIVLSNLTDTSSVSHGATGDYNLELTADVIRNTLANLSYNRADDQLRSKVYAEYRELEYRTNTENDRVDRSVGATMDYPLTQLLSSGVYAQYKRIEAAKANPYREDKLTTIGANLKYRFSKKLHGIMDLKYRTKDSTNDASSFDEFSIFASLSYGFSSSFRPTRVGSF